jgi:regulator of sigma E protease
MGIVTSILVLSFLIFFHELGHFLAARYFGVRVEVFSIGFGKAVIKKVIGDTEYRLSAIPLGGYVKMKGQDDSDPLKVDTSEGSYATKHPLKRIIILFAGSFFNILLAFLLYIAIGLIGERTLAPVIGEFSPNMPAVEAGLKSGDKIVAIGGEQIRSWSDLSEHIKDSSGNLEFKIERNGRYFNYLIEPILSDSKNIFQEDVKRKLIGIAPSGDVVTIHYSPFEAIPFALEKTIEASRLIILGIQKLIQGIVPVDQVGGVISIVQVTSSAADIGIVALFTLTALISVNLGILNLLPIPALDGGHIIFTVYELIAKRKPSENVLYKLTIFGWVLLFGLMFLGLYNDINRLTGPNPIP